jgi:SAM-dependent methyltransferase
MMTMLAVMLRRALFGVGPIATIRAAVRHAVQEDPELRRRAGEQKPLGLHPFDTAFGVDTSGFVSWRELQSGNENDPYISGYLGIAPSVARHVLRLVCNPADYVFVDLGCGKGRATMVASEFPFQRVLGIEIASELAMTARRNAAVIRASFPERPEIEIAHCDAAAFEFPNAPLVLFLYQPFEKPVLRRVLLRLEQSLAAAPRRAVVIYVNPVLGRVLDRFPLLERAVSGTCELQPNEIPFSYGGAGPADAFSIWRSHHPRPALTFGARPGSGDDDQNWETA